MLTPRLADIAFVLEDVPGVLEVYALGDSHFEVAVKVEQGGRAAARAHYALLRVLTHEECRSVMLFEVELPRGLGARATRLVLTASDREAARSRVPTSPPSFSEEQDLPPSTWRRMRAGAPFSALLVDCHDDAYAATVTALGAGARRVLERDPSVAVRTALAGGFDLILCPARLAFGTHGFLRRVHAEDVVVASRVVLIAAPSERRLVLASLDALDAFNLCLSPPLDPPTLLAFARSDCFVLPFHIPVLPPRGSTPALVTPSTAPRRVLVIDEDVRTHGVVEAMRSAAFEATATDDPWVALDALDASPPPHLVLCSAAMRMGRVALYRALWDAHPELKSRFVLVLEEDGTPESIAPSRERPLTSRPLTVHSVEEALERFGAR
ncbi:MAG: hypothetical protein KC657_21215 [Myxococcales bacterium]|nr:hypothetical protein [Myxococcales bacterium]